MVGTLSHGEFYVSDPLRNELTLKLHATPQEACDCMGTFTMACIVQAGHAYYNTTVVHNLPPLSKHQGRKPNKEKPSVTVHENDDDDDNEPLQPSENEIDSLITNLPNLATLGRIPKIDDIQPFLRNAFKSLDRNDHFFLQSILSDIYVVQHWTRPLNNEEDKLLRSLHSNHHKKTVDLTNSNEEHDIFDTLSIDTLKFDGLKSVAGKEPVNSRKKKKKGTTRKDKEKTGEDEEESTSDTLRTPASSNGLLGTSSQSSATRMISTSSEKRRENMSTAPNVTTLDNNDDNGM